MNSWVIGSFYTLDTPYEDVVQEYLLKSCERFPQIRYTISVANNFGNWYRNVAEKPRIILQMLKDLPPEQCLVFVDADATIEKYPVLFDTIPEEFDIGCHYLNWNRWYGYQNDPPVQELLTGTMFFRNRPEVHALCQHWYEDAKISTDWEQVILSRIIRSYKLNFYELPIEYIYIKTRPDNRPPLVQCDPVILHHQVSRQYKRMI